MKKLIVSTLLAVLASLLVCSCSKEDSFSLVGKTFATVGYHSDAMTISGLHFDGYDAYYVYRFLTETTAERSTRKNSPKGSIIGDMENCTYTLSYPNITIKYVDGSTEYTVNGTFIDKETFRVVGQSYGTQKTWEYTLQ